MPRVARVGSTGTNTMFPGIGNSSTGRSAVTSFQKSIQIGSAARAPVPSRPSEFTFSSKPTQTPAASDGS